MNKLSQSEVIDRAVENRGKLNEKLGLGSMKVSKEELQQHAKKGGKTGMQARLELRLRGCK